MGAGDTLLRLFVQGVIDGSSFALLGISFGYVLFVTGRLHFAYGFSYTIAAYACAVVSSVAGMPLAGAAAIGVAAAVLAGVVIELGIYRSVIARNPDGALVGVFVAALGVNVAGDSIISLIWGQQSQSVFVATYTPTVFHWGPIYVADVQLATVIFAAVVVLAGSLLLRYTNAGRVVRGTSANHELAKTVGIRLELLYVVIFAVASLVAGVLAVLSSMRVSATPEMGNQPVFYGFLVAFLAGRGSSLVRIAIAGMATGLLSDLTQFWLSPEYSQVLIFGLLSLYVASQPFVKDRTSWRRTRNFTRVLRARERA